MAIRERLTGTLQENIISLLAHNDEYGKVVANLVKAELFDGEYRTIAERCIHYWHKYNRAPGLHTPDLFSEILEDTHHKKGPTYNRILTAMLELSEGINGPYILQELKTFTREQRFADAVFKTAEKLERRNETTVEEIEVMWAELLHANEIEFDRGLRLDEFETVLEHMENHHGEFTTGIHELDHNGIVPSRGEVFMFMAATNKGKSWLLCTVGRAAMLLHKKVLHVTLEMDAAPVAQRYYQMLFSAARRSSDVNEQQIRLKLEKGRLADFKFEDIEPEFTFEDTELARAELTSRFAYVGERYSNLLIKRFPTRGLTVRQLEAYLDNLEVVDGFIPDLLIIDYPKIMKIDEKNFRLSLTSTLDDLRGLAVRRNCALVAAHQLSKEGASANRPTMAQGEEAWAINQTCDTTVIYASTPMEEKYGLARLYVDKARSERGKFGVLITQNYGIGQFVLQSTYLRNDYYEQLKDLADSNKHEDDTEDDDD